MSGQAGPFLIKRGYIFNRKGVYYKEKICETDAVCRNNDELTLIAEKLRKNGFDVEADMVGRSTESRLNDFGCQYEIDVKGGKFKWNPKNLVST